MLCRLRASLHLPPLQVQNKLIANVSAKPLTRRSRSKLGCRAHIASESSVVWEGCGLLLCREWSGPSAHESQPVVASQASVRGPGCRFMGAQQAAILFRSSINLEEFAEHRREQLSTGVFVLADVFCRCCQSLIGWRYLSSESPGNAPTPLPPMAAL